MLARPGFLHLDSYGDVLELLLNSENVNRTTPNAFITALLAALKLKSVGSWLLDFSLSF